MAARSRSLKRSLVQSKDDRNKFLREFKDYISQQSHGLRHWTGPRTHSTWGESLLSRRAGPVEEGPGDILIGIHTGDGPDGCISPTLTKQAPLLVVRVKRVLSPKTANANLKKEIISVSFNRRTHREIVDEYDSFYFGGTEYHNRAASTLAKLLEPLLQSFADRL